MTAVQRWNPVHLFSLCHSGQRNGKKFASENDKLVAKLLSSFLRSLPVGSSSRIWFEVVSMPFRRIDEAKSGLMLCGIKENEADYVTTKLSTGIIDDETINILWRSFDVLDQVITHCVEAGSAKVARIQSILEVMEPELPFLEWRGPIAYRLERTDFDLWISDLQSELYREFSVQDLDKGDAEQAVAKRIAALRLACHCILTRDVNLAQMIQLERMSSVVDYDIVPRGTQHTTSMVKALELVGLPSVIQAEDWGYWGASEISKPGLRFDRMTAIRALMSESLAARIPHRMESAPELFAKAVVKLMEAVNNTGEDQLEDWLLYVTKVKGDVSARSHWWCIRKGHQPLIDVFSGG